MILDDMIKDGSKFLIINQSGDEVNVATSTNNEDELLRLIANYVEAEVIRREEDDAEKIKFMTALILGIRNVAEGELPEEKKIVFYKTVHAIMAGLFDTEWSEFNERMGN